ncbi:histone H1.4 [Sinocyclocheilus rhinocerous]|uniref:Histone H1 n=1 Tax=Sinocyclocheilus rhinocerous TaxID=307959 RepID=A0A673M877_9TELE|nr:PREDICTED: histone H1.4-like [Sinocyclocheilus rhinocerous]
MSTAFPSAPSSATKTPRRRSKAKKSGASVSDLILKVLSSSKERGGVSLVALKKALAASGYDVERNNSRIKLAVKRLVASGRLIQTKGTGASGSFKIGSKAATKPKKPKAKRAKRKTAKKPAGAKKSPKKRRRSLRSPEKASETAAVKKTTKPKRAKRRASKTSKAKTAKK